MSSKLKPLFILPLIAAVPAAHAADIPVIPPPEVVSTDYPTDFMSIEGGPVWMKGDLDEVNPMFGQDKFGEIDDHLGFYAAISYRHMFDPNWDGQITATGTWLGDVSGNRIFVTAPVEANSDLDFQTIDLDAGYHLNGNPLTRFLFGARVLHSEDSLSLTEQGFTWTHNANGWAAGPRAGFQSEIMLGGSNFGFLAEGSGSVLFGSFDINSFDGDGYPFSKSDSRTIYNLEGLAGLSWHASDHMTLSAGYRVQQWWGLRDGTSLDLFGFGENGSDYKLSADEDPLIHGPFFRAAAKF